jgi:hypothetical protein
MVFQPRDHGLYRNRFLRHFDFITLASPFIFLDCRWSAFELVCIGVKSNFQMDSADIQFPSGLYRNEVPMHFDVLTLPYPSVSFS